MTCAAAGAAGLPVPQPPQHRDGVCARRQPADTHPKQQVRSTSSMPVSLAVLALPTSCMLCKPTAEQMSTMPPATAQVGELFQVQQYMQHIRMHSISSLSLTVRLLCCAGWPCRVLSEDKARWLFQQLIFAVDYCHRKGALLVWMPTSSNSVHSMMAGFRPAADSLAATAV